MANKLAASTPPDALLFVAPGCPHCPVVERGIHELKAEGLVGQVTVLNVVENSEQAVEYGVRAAPWLRLGVFTLTGAHSVTELRQWAIWASGEEGTARYVEHLLQQGSFPQAVAFVAADTQRLQPLLAMLADVTRGVDIRLGVSALLERYADTAALRELLPQLASLTTHADHRVRADVCYLLGLTGSVVARPLVSVCLNDASEEVREIAKEALDELAALK
jgi:thiol-disulfide isomerase/thioredoxin